MSSSMITRIEHSIARTRTYELEAARQRAIRRQFDEWEQNLIDMAVRAQLAEELVREQAEAKRAQEEWDKALKAGKAADAKFEAGVRKARQARRDRMTAKFVVLAPSAAIVLYAVARLVAFFS